jgi:hypothetical protein
VEESPRQGWTLLLVLHHNVLPRSCGGHGGRETGKLAIAEEGDGSRDGSIGSQEGAQDI